MTSRCCDRRRFLHASALTAGSAALLTACGGEESAQAGSPILAEGGSWTEVMPLQELEVGASSTASVGATQLLLHRSHENTVHAFSAICTHEGCAVGTEPEQFACPCHGSTFDLQTGAPQSGPARGPLTRYPAEISGESVQVKV